MMSTSHLDIQRHGAVTSVFMDRPAVHNAFDDALIRELTDTFAALDDDDRTRVVILGGRGKSFSAGADLHWMKSMLGYSIEENRRDSEAAARMFLTIDRCSKPVIGRVHGAALGGGTGLVAVCDIAIGVPEARFGFTEVKLGIIPAVISPYVVRRIGATHARELFLTGERFDGARAQAIGLLDHVVPPAALDGAIERVVERLRSSGPGAMAAIKDLIRRVAGRDPEDVLAETATAIAEARISPEGQEGMNAFLDKRSPAFKV